MNPKPASQTRSQNRTRRHSSCYLHPADPAAGICASCLRERLSGLDSLADLEPPPISISFLGGGAGAGVSGLSSSKGGGGGVLTSPDFRRCRSVSTAKCDASAAFAEPRRNSCDVRPLNGNSLSRLFDVDDECGGSVAESKVETKNILSGAAIDIGEEHGDTQVGGNDAIDDYGDDGEGKTMKEYIDLELQSRNRKLKDLRDLAGNFREAASVFSKKLRKWRQKQKAKKLSYGSDQGGITGGKSETNSLKGLTLEDIQSEVQDYSMGRRSCDIEPRFSVDGGRASFEEPRASWDGYLIARTIPRLTPMLSGVENVMLAGGNKLDSHGVSVDGQMNSIMEDETSSGGSGQSNSEFDSSSSQRRSSFDRSSSVRSFGKKIVGLEGDDLKYISSNAKVSPPKLVITERELEDWRLNSVKVDDDDQVGKPCVPKEAIESKGGGSKKSVRWRRKMLNVFGFKQKAREKEYGSSSCDAVDSVATDASEKQQREFSEEVKDAANGWRLMRNGSVVGPRRSVDVIGSNNIRRSLLNDGYVNNGREQFLLDQNRSNRCTSSNFDDATLPFYLTPLRSSRRRNSICISGNVLQLN